MRTAVAISIVLAFFVNEVTAQFVKIFDRVIVAGYVFEESTGQPLEYVNIYVRRTRCGTISDTSGYFVVKARQADTLVFSCLGYDKKYVTINDSMSNNDKPIIVFLDTKIYELASVNIVALKRYKQFEYDFLNMQVADNDYDRAMKHAPTPPSVLAYYKRSDPTSTGISMSPISALYNLFSKEGREQRKLAEIQQKDRSANLLENKIGIDIIMQITGQNREQTNIFIDDCKLSENFVANISEYELIQILKYKFKYYKLTH